MEDIKLVVGLGSILSGVALLVAVVVPALLGPATPFVYGAGTLTLIAWATYGIEA